MENPSSTLSDLPHDDDGEALRLVARDGSDMTMPMFINFHVAVPDQRAAEEMADMTRKLGYLVRIYDSAECRLPWTCECSTRMVATYEAVLAIQRELETISARFGGFPDGWGTFGNGPNGQHDVKQEPP
jgi:regulator of RNase E activity RraB